MSRRLDIGVCSYRNPGRLRATLESIEQMTSADYRLFVIHNPSDGEEDAAAREVIAQSQRENGRIAPIWMDQNVGYAGAVNHLFQVAESEYIAYTDNDIEIRTPGWDGSLCEVLDGNPECGWVFPGPGHYGFHNGRYRECLWNAGYCWILRSEAMRQVAEKRPAPNDTGFDTTLGHHDEVDYMIRLRLSGWRVGCVPEVNVVHHESATQSSETLHKPGGRIHDGVVRWMNRWNAYFCGDEIKYSMTTYDPRALRYTDWNVDALYLERMTLSYFPSWNAHPRTVHVPGVGEMDVVEVLKPKGPYKGRAI